MINTYIFFTEYKYHLGGASAILIIGIIALVIVSNGDNGAESKRLKANRSSSQVVNDILKCMPIIDG